MVDSTNRGRDGKHKGRKEMKKTTLNLIAGICLMVSAVCWVVVAVAQ